LDGDLSVCHHLTAEEEAINKSGWTKMFRVWRDIRFGPVGTRPEQYKAKCKTEGKAEHKTVERADVGRPAGFELRSRSVQVTDNVEELDPIQDRDEDDDYDPHKRDSVVVAMVTNPEYLPTEEREREKKRVRMAKEAGIPTRSNKKVIKPLEEHYDDCGHDLTPIVCVCQLSGVRIGCWQRPL